ncbi:MAG: DUF438 domain-containing protein [Spirochaetales bacterium]|nr:DUF438 domain-containing protein [Spirochaetales bacterium]
MKNNIDEKQIANLMDFSKGIMQGENGKQLIDRYQKAIDNVTPFDIIELENRQMNRGVSTLDIKKSIGKILNAFYTPLASYEWEKPAEGTFLYYLMLENKALEEKLNSIKQILKKYHTEESFTYQKLRQKLIPLFLEILDFDEHYIKKENVLFPYIEKHWNNYNPIKIMWSLHDDIRNSLKEIILILENPLKIWDQLNIEIGRFFFLTFGMILKEDRIIYPVALETIPKKDWQEMHLQSFEIPFTFIETPKKPDIIIKEGSWQNECSFTTESGEISFDQLKMIFENLTVEMTMIDENDKVVFYSESENRIFPRSSAIIGRDVQNCHPPESVHIVNEIISTFKKGTKQKAEFWFNFKEKFVFTTYYALHNKSGSYKGILEVSQDIRRFKDLEGERKLLNWD